MFSRICDRRASFRRAFADFSLFDRIFRVFAGALLQSRRSGLFKRVFRRFTSLYAPVKENPCPALKLRFKLFSAPHREFSFQTVYFRVLKMLCAIYGVTLVAPPTHSDAQNVLGLAICRITRFRARRAFPFAKSRPDRFYPFFGAVKRYSVSPSRKSRICKSPRRNKIEHLRLLPLKIPKRAFADTENTRQKKLAGFRPQKSH